MTNMQKDITVVVSIPGLTVELTQEFHADTVYGIGGPGGHAEVMLGGHDFAGELLDVARAAIVRHSEIGAAQRIAGTSKPLL